MSDNQTLLLEFNKECGDLPIYVELAGEVFQLWTGYLWYGDRKDNVLEFSSKDVSIFRFALRMYLDGYRTGYSNGKY